MKKLILFIFLPLTLIFAQTNEEEKAIDLTGKFALMFQIDQNFDLNSFDGMSFAGKYFFSDDWGVRFAFQTSFQDYDQTANIIESSTDETFGMSYNRDLKMYKFMPSVLYNLVTNNSIKFYIGAGPFLSYSNDERADVTFDSPKTTKSRWVKNTEIGLNLFGSVEWFVSHNISLSAEYGFQYSYRESEIWDRRFEDDELVDEIDIKTTGKQLSDLPVSLGVSIYF